MTLLKKYLIFNESVRCCTCRGQGKLEKCYSCNGTGKIKCTNGLTSFFLLIICGGSIVSGMGLINGFDMYSFIGFIILMSFFIVTLKEYKEQKNVK